MKSESNSGKSIPRRKFIGLSIAGMGAIGSLTSAAAASVGADEPAQINPPAPARRRRRRRPYNGGYDGEYLNQIAFPLGGIGAGMVCLEGTGAISNVSLRNRPEVFNEPCMFAAISIKSPRPAARLLEGPVPARKIFGPPGTGNGGGGSSHGLPRFGAASFKARFPFATAALADERIPLSVKITGWSPFEPNDADNSSLPVAALEYQFTNTKREKIEAVFSFNTKNFVAGGNKSQAVRPVDGGFILWNGGATDRPWDEAAFSVTTSDPAVKVNHAWFRGDWWDPLTLAWKDVAQGACYERAPIASGDASPGATLFVPFELAPGASKSIVVRLAWYDGETNLRVGRDRNPDSAQAKSTYRPWYAGRFSDINSVTYYWKERYDALRQKSERFASCFYDSSLPPEVTEAVAANFAILKSPTILRQTDGKLWGWEGCADGGGCCAGSCTHVWNYAQSIPHLFPALERTLRETEFGPSQDETGHQDFRTFLPIRPVSDNLHPAADGQLGGIMKAYREWRVSGDTDWMRKLWPRVKQSLAYCIQTWDPDHTGVLMEPHHNTYDIWFWGPDGMCASIYLGALQAAILMGKALGDEQPLYAQLLADGSKKTETELFNGEYFYQRIQWTGLRAANPVENNGGDYSPEAMAILRKEGPKYQYGLGCLADGVLGCWFAQVCGVGQVLDARKVRSHLQSVYRHNLRHDLSDFANPQRPTYACGSEGGLVLCTWPKGGELSLPFPYSNEVWTSLEYQVASHHMRMGMVKEALDIVRTARDRYDGRTRNPFNEYECGHWYARAMSSYALLFGMSGARYDAVEKILYLEPAIKGDFHCFLSTAAGYGTVGVRHGQPFYTPASGTLEIREIKYTART
ncbi:MAG TPA: GH116 family glycosyl hydrolase [Verrucomicrobiae bacterium]|jgi:uncharacterized protein (DUF608 family)